MFADDQQPLSAAERLRVAPGANRGQMPPQGAPHHYNRHRDNREMMDKSKSIPNLHLDNSMDGRMAPGAMRPAQSVSALQQQQQRIPNPQHPDYYNHPHSLDDSRSHDYENQPVRQPQDPQGRPYPGSGQQPSPGGQYRPPNQPSPSARQMQPQSFERPQSQYFPHQDRPEFQNGRPRSEEINPERLPNWHDMDRSQGSPHDSFENRTPNYSNIRQQPNYANQGDIRKMDMPNQQAKPSGLYENAYQRQPEPASPFQQQMKPGMMDKNRPPTAPKPAKSLPNVNPVIEKPDIDNRMSQSFYGQQMREKSMYPSSSSPNYNTSPSSHYQNTSFHDGRGDISSKMSPSHADYMIKNPDELPPELPPPPTMDELGDDDLPPLPPPPATDYRLEQKIREEQNRMMQQQQLSDPSYSNLPPQNSRNQPFSGNQSLPAGYQPPPTPHGYQPVMSSGYQPGQPQSLPVQALAHNTNHDYQNIAYPNRNAEHSPNAQNPYESYDPRKVPQPQQQPGRPPINPGQIKDQREAIVSPWQREEREKQQRQQQDGVNRMREMEIAELESRHRTPQEEERLRKLRLDQEFQRRLEEAQDKDSDDSDEERFVSTYCLTLKNYPKTLWY